MTSQRSGASCKVLYMYMYIYIYMSECLTPYLHTSHFHISVCVILADLAFFDLSWCANSICTREQFYRIHHNQLLDDHQQLANTLNDLPRRGSPTEMSYRFAYGFFGVIDTSGRTLILGTAWLIWQPQHLRQVDIVEACSFLLLWDYAAKCILIFPLALLQWSNSPTCA